MLMNVRRFRMVRWFAGGVALVAGVLMVGSATSSGALTCRRPITLSGRERAPIDGGRVELNANEYGSRASFTIRGCGGAADFTITHSSINQTAVGAYPSLFLGRHGDFVTQHDPFPLRVSAIRPGQVRIGVDTVTPRSARRARWVDFYDIFLTAGAHANQFTSTREELEIWQNAANRGAYGPSKRVSLDGHLYNVYDLIPSQDTVAYVPVKFPSDSFRGDLRPFIRDSVRRGYAHGNWYLADVEHGFEINSGPVVGLGDRDFFVRVG
jgi:hypothetical protein